MPLPQELAEYAALYLYQSGHNPAYQYTARTLAELPCPNPAKTGTEQRAVL